jgi:glucose dehydrogenase
MVYIGSSDANLYALNATTGALVWSYPTNQFVYSSPAVADGVVYVGSGDHNVYALDADIRRTAIANGFGVPNPRGFRSRADRGVAAGPE